LIGPAHVGLNRIVTIISDKPPIMATATRFAYALLNNGA